MMYNMQFYDKNYSNYRSLNVWFLSRKRRVESILNMTPVNIMIEGVNKVKDGIPSFPSGPVTKLFSSKKI